MLPARSRRQLQGSELPQPVQERSCQDEQLRGRARVDSGIDLQDAGAGRACSGLGFEGDEEPTAGDVERKRAYADWLARFEPGEDRRRQDERRHGLGAHQIHSGSGERAA